MASVDEAEMPALLETARANLNSTVFFGISDHWNTTVCLFHKELNGPGPRPSEYINARKTGDNLKPDLSDARLVGGECSGFPRTSGLHAACPIAPPLREHLTT